MAINTGVYQSIPRNTESEDDYYARLHRQYNDPSSGYGSVSMDWIRQNYPYQTQPVPYDNRSAAQIAQEQTGASTIGSQAINGQSAYEQFLQNGYWPDEESRTAGLQWAGQAQNWGYNGPSGNPAAGNNPSPYMSNIGLSNPYAQVYNPQSGQYEDKSSAPRTSAYNVIGGGGTSSAPTAAAGTRTAQGYSGGPTAAPGMPAPLGGDNPLANAVLQGYGMGLAPFNTQWYDNLGSSLFNQASKNYTENIAPAINSGAQLAGQYGGNRGEIAKGMALQGLNQNVMNALAPQYAQGYENWLNRGVGVGDSAMRGLLGIGGLDINAYNAQTAAAQAAAGAAGTPQYTSPWGAGLGTAITLAGLSSLWGK